MPRPKRFDLPGIPQYVVQRGNNRQNVFFRPEDRRAYLEWLAEGARRYALDVHAYSLMNSDVHLLMTPWGKASLSRTLQHLGSRYVCYINSVHGRTGTLWEGRYKASVIDSERYLLSCYQYIELNPVRAGIVKHPREYAWSSYRVNAEGEDDGVVLPHNLYRALGESAEARIRGYRMLFTEALDPDIEEAIRQAITRNYILGDDDFRTKLERLTGRRIHAKGRGRPPAPRRERASAGKANASPM